ncbi:hypothetical protein N0V88_007804 [Collariella sp. IMI 366227]|nr:hypothetical protein N0V88_007804 [Collariella sp. IMI 366227]
MGEATCAELLQDGPSDVVIGLEALGLSETYLAGRESLVQLLVHHDLGVLGVLPAFSAQVAFSVGNKGDKSWASSACVYFEITPQLPKDVSAAVRYGLIAIFLLVFVFGLFATLSASIRPVRRPAAANAAPNENHQQVVEKAILPGVGDCLLYFQFIFFLGALTLRYPGFYQPLTGLVHWSALFSPSGPFGGRCGPFGGRWYDGVSDGVYEVNGTLTGSYGLELMSQFTGGPLTMDVWRNMVVFAAIITAVATLFMLAYRFVPQFLGFSSLQDNNGEDGLVSNKSAIILGTWNVLRMVLSYFITPIVAISAYQLDNEILPAYHLALATLLMVLVVVGLTWIWRIAPSNQLGALLLDPSKRYRRLSINPSDSESGSAHLGEKRDIFAVIFFVLAFARGIAAGGLQFSPLAQVLVLALIELALLVSTAVLRPLRGRVLSVFTWSGIARLVVITLSTVFLPELDMSISVRSRVAIAILGIHAAVLALGCAVPATIRLVGLVWKTGTSADEPEIYGLSQLRRRSDAINDLSSPPPSISNTTRPDSPASYYSHNQRSPNDVSSISFYVDHNSAPDRLYLRAVPQHHYFRPPRSSGSLRRPDATYFNTLPPPTSNTTPPHSSTSQSISKPDSPSPSRQEESSPITITTVAASVTSTTPLSPQWSDYSFREADLYYGHGRPQRAETIGGGGASATTAAPTQMLRQQPSTVRRVVSDVRGQLTGWKASLGEMQPTQRDLR